METQRLQEAIISSANAQVPAQPLSAETVEAFFAVPRHAFVQRYLRDGKFVEVTAQNLEEHVLAIYQDGPLVLFEDEAQGVLSTMSQPSLVLRMMDLLRLERGQRVFELGAGSGWNAALLGHRVGPEGRVYSIEIVPDVARMAAQAISKHGADNVEIVSGDGGAGYALGAPYDRAVFTAGSEDIPRAFHEQVRTGGLLLTVLQLPGGGDLLMRLEKRASGFFSTLALPCDFVPMTGPNAAHSALEGLDALPEWSRVHDDAVERQPFWGGGHGPFAYFQTLSLRSFLSLSEPGFFAVSERRSDEPTKARFVYGIRDPGAGSLAVIDNEAVTSYGNSVARDRLMTRLHEWVDLGMPPLSAFELRVVPRGTDVAQQPNQWIVRRRDSDFIWSLPAVV